MGIMEIIALVTSVAPKLIGAGVSIYDVWKDAGDIIGNAESNNGKVDPEAYAALKKKCDDIDALIQKRADEARG